MFISPVRRFTGEIIPFLVFACALLGSLFIIRGVAMPQWRAFQTSHARTSQYRALSSDKNRFQAVKALLVEKQALLERKYECFAPKKGAGTPEDVPGLLQLLIQRAGDFSIRLDKIQPVEDVKRMEKGRYPVILQMTTSYSSLGRYISSLERIPRMVSVDRIAITAGKQGLETRILVTCFLNRGD